MHAVTLEQVRKTFDGVRAVEALSARVPEGCIYGFLGPNGAGKSTTLRMIINILAPDSGRVEVLGSASIRAVKDRVGYMPEERGLYGKMKVAQVLSYFASIKGLSRSEAGGAARRWLDRVQLAGWADRKVEELSRGMQQKLQFAVTCVSDPDLLVLDEPFSGLDPVNLDLLKGIVLQLRGQGKTVLFSTHVMHEAERLCDFLLLINKGRKVVDGTLEQIRARYRSNAVLLESDATAPFLEGLPMVASVRQDGRRLEVALTDTADSQDLLTALAGRVRVHAFQVKVPSLHEIFVHLVGGSHAPDA
jgi:ABC-2 type transport system ATP-binding protein